MVCFDIEVCLQAFRKWAAFIFNANIDLVSQFSCTIGQYFPCVAITTSLWILLDIIGSIRNHCVLKQVSATQKAIVSGCSSYDRVRFQPLNLHSITV